MDTQARFSKLTILLHWTVAILMIGLIAVGIYMTQLQSYALYPWHKSFGVVVFLVALLRVAWRLKNGWPVPASHYKAIEHATAQVVHWLLIISTLAMPISGMLLSSMLGHNIPFFGIDLVHAIHDPANPTEVIPRNETVAHWAGEVHEIVGYGLIFAIALHIVGALKHHTIDKDGTLRRMFGAKI